MGKPIAQKVLVAALIFNKGKVLIILRDKNDDVFPGLWEIPSGKKENFEKTEDALVREVKEEVGLDVSVEFPVSVFGFRVEKENEIRDVTQINFLVKTIGKSDVSLSEEHEDFGWISEDEFDNYNLTPETRSSISKAFALIKK